jgi:ATPase subunit of ABC transporter with duplicated ATPase domains
MKIAKEQISAVLAQFNPWWRGEPIADIPGWRRAAFAELHAWMTAPPAPRAVMLSGARQIGKTTLMHCIAGVLKPTAGSINWVENAEPGYMPQDPQAEFEEKTDLFKWMQQWSGKADDEQIVRATLGRLLFSGDETKKSVKVLSGGEKGRMMYGKLMLTRPNVLLLDEPTNHMDMETIESLQIGLEKYPGTLLFVSHDREFVSGLATRIIEIQPGGGIVDVHGDYDEYLKSQGLAV